MKTFKKITKGAAIVIGVLLLILLGTLIYRNATSYKNVIHKDAVAVAKIRVDAIGKSVLWDAIKHPSYYYEHQEESDSLDDEVSRDKGFTIPANIFVYMVKGKSMSTLFTSLKISNIEDFKAFLKTDLKAVEKYQLDEITIAKTEDEKLLIAYTKDQFVFTYNPKKESVDSIFKDLLIDKKTLSDSNSLFKKIKNATSHISFLTTEDEISIEFVSGKANIKGHLAISKYLSIPSQRPHPEFSENSSLKFYLNALSSKTHEPIKVKDFEIETDSILAHYNGNLSIELSNATTQRDTIVTYDYNDDFEKVATKTVSEKQVPEITMQLTADSHKMMKYLRNASFLENNTINRELFPLYQVKVDSTEFGLRATTNLDKPLSTSVISNKNVFGLDVDFVKLKAQNQFPFLNLYFERLLNLKLTGKKQNSKINVKGQIHLKNPDILAISQFL